MSKQCVNKFLVCVNQNQPCVNLFRPFSSSNISTIRKTFSKSLDAGLKGNVLLTPSTLLARSCKVTFWTPKTFTWFTQVYTVLPPDVGLWIHSCKVTFWTPKTFTWFTQVYTVLPPDVGLWIHSIHRKYTLSHLVTILHCFVDTDIAGCVESVHWLKYVLS